MVAQWFPNDEIIVSGDSAYGGRSILSHLPPNVHLISHVHPNGALYEAVRLPGREKRKGRARKKGEISAARHGSNGPTIRTDRGPNSKFDRVRLAMRTFGWSKTIQALVRQGGARTDF